MLRLRMTCLALATGLVFTLSGCCSFCEDGRLFPRLFRSNSMSAPHGMGAECDCHNAHSPNLMMEPAAQGPTLMPGSTVPIIRNIPPNQPPQVFKVPTAPTTPYVPSN